MTRNLFSKLAQAAGDQPAHSSAWYALVGAFTHIERDLRQQLAERFDMSLPRLDTLTALAMQPNGLTMGELAEQLLVTKGNVTGVVRTLESHALVRRTSPRHDKRVQVVRLTAKGKKLSAQLNACYDEVVAQHMAQLPQRSLTSLTRALLKLQESEK